mmetsp:Transcript_781/g.1600  ORF Transcript_781/g.1600 Transcript_781/m.1600 type:complete len:227 (-) Transcript_781:432-1112(-)
MGGTIGNCPPRSFGTFVRKRTASIRNSGRRLFVEVHNVELPEAENSKQSTLQLSNSKIKNSGRHTSTSRASIDEGIGSETQRTERFEVAGSPRLRGSTQRSGRPFPERGRKMRLLSEYLSHYDYAFVHYSWSSGIRKRMDIIFQQCCLPVFRRYFFSGRIGTQHHPIRNVLSIQFFVAICIAKVTIPLFIGASGLSTQLRPELGISEHANICRASVQGSRVERTVE